MWGEKVIFSVYIFDFESQECQSYFDGFRFKIAGPPFTKTICGSKVLVNFESSSRATSQPLMNESAAPLNLETCAIEKHDGNYRIFIGLERLVWFPNTAEIRRLENSNTWVRAFFAL